MFYKLAASEPFRLASTSTTLDELCIIGVIIILSYSMKVHNDEWSTAAIAVMSYVASPIFKGYFLSLEPGF